MIFAHLARVVSNLPVDASALENSISALESAISALEAAIRAQDNRSVPWEHALPWFTGMVIVGVALEWWIILLDFREERETWALEYFGVTRSAPRPSVGKLAVEIISVALIVLGIFGELGTGLEIASINNSLRAKSAELRSKNAELRSKSDQLLALVTQQAGNAAKSAETAKADAVTAEAKAEAAGLSAEKAGRDGRVLAQKLEAQTQREKAAEMALEAERQKRMKLAASLQNRDVCNQVELGSALSGFAPRNIIFEWVSDKEPRLLAEQIAWSFAYTHNRWPMVRRQVIEDAIKDGVHILGKDQVGWRVASVLSSKLNACGIEAESMGDPLAEGDPANALLSSNDVLIRIGSRPNRQIEAAIEELGPTAPKSNIFATRNLATIPNEAAANSNMNTEH